MRILLIDDDRDDQAIFCEAVKTISPHALCDLADNGKEGLQLLNSYDTLPNVIFLDINMPIMDGRQTLRSIKQTPGLASLPVIMYSTSSHQLEIDEFRVMGAQYLVKANSFEDLVRSIRRFITLFNAVHQSETSLNISRNH
jgi:CheY-like chemotaxis protein